MSYYRLYFLNPQGSRIERFEELHAADDFEAINAASKVAGKQPLEMWSGARKVRYFEPRPFNGNAR